MEQEMFNACVKNDIERVSELISQGYSVDFNLKFYSLIGEMEICFNNDILKLLLKNSKERTLETCLYYSYLFDKDELVQLIENTELKIEKLDITNIPLKVLTRDIIEVLKKKDNFREYFKINKRAMLTLRG